MKPLLKWAGNKYDLRLKLATAAGGTFDGPYVDPFCGSLGAFLGLREEGVVEGPAYLSDSNPRLVGLHRWTRDSPKKLHEKLARLPTVGVDESRYYRLRDIYNRTPPSHIDSAALTVWLNKAGFNGLHRYNRSGGYNVPAGKSIQAAGTVGGIPDLDHVLAVSEALQGAWIGCRDWRATTHRWAAPGALVYLDPPYAPVDVETFTAYTAAGFDAGDQRALAAEAEDAGSKGSVVVLSNHDAPHIRELYPTGKVVWSGTLARSIGAAGRTDAHEMIVRFG